VSVEGEVMQYTTIKYEVSEMILTLTLNRPDQLNAFTIVMANELEHAFRRASDDDEVRAIVVTGAGRAFCAGMDLSVEGNVFGLDERQTPTVADTYELFDDEQFRTTVRDSGGRVSLAIFDCTKPIIAAINGAAVGFGATMTTAMDIRVASDDARIGFVFGRIGIVPEGCSTWFLPRIVGVSRALEWMYTTDILTADEALVGGLLNSVHPAREMLNVAYEMARKFTDHRSSVSRALIRQMVYRNSAQLHPIEAHRIETLSVFYTALNDGKEGVAAFLEKRDPQFRAKVSTDMPPFYPWQPSSAPNEEAT
jgi:enoyl-CoA hydratase/carnithine racemase